WANAPRLRALSERSGVLYAAGDDSNNADAFAVARSSDLGAHWTPMLRFRNIAGVKDCELVHQRCDQYWPDLVTQLGIVGVELPDAGAPPVVHNRGCGCGEAGGAIAALGLLWLTAACWRAP